MVPTAMSKLLLSRYKSETMRAVRYVRKKLFMSFLWARPVLCPLLIIPAKATYYFGISLENP